ncbi:putative adhesin [Endozoicomonas euniceicola]|uniref:Putative adhesin Stv domain-containing protein n=1 Tax=Endozoicomonas euniceicola TaxID=1234143 RepID=A0ABY6H052_9GAMM|nr:hypothetical protein [Endozoicomonas euniceicola]UYM18419.1 hypothetical protein NX720_11115 [Endozoicomonas euniceicola]
MPLRNKVKYCSLSESKCPAKDILLHTYDVRAPNLIVVAYARYFSETHNFTKETSTILTVPNWTTLFFYCPLNSTIEVRIKDVMSGLYSPFEFISGGQATHEYMLFNYDLSYLEGKEAVMENRADQKKTKKNSPQLYDIAYIFGHATIFKLSSFLEELHRNGKPYQRVHCLFNRVAFGVHEDLVPVFSPELNPLPGTHEGDLGKWVLI